MTSLRTIYGCEEQRIIGFGEEYHRHFLQNINIFTEEGLVLLNNDKYVLQNAGKPIADYIIGKLFLV